MSFFKKLVAGVKDANKELKRLKAEDAEIKNMEVGDMFKVDVKRDDYGTIVKRPEPTQPVDKQQGVWGFELKEADRKNKYTQGQIQSSNNPSVYRVIALIVDPDTKQQLGFRVVTENTLIVEDLTMEQFMSNASNLRLANGKLTRKGFETTDGSSLKKFPVLRADNLYCIENDFVIVRARVVNDETGELEGFIVTDYRGESQTISPQELANYKRIGYLNFKMSIKNDKPVFQALKGTIPGVLLSKVTQGYLNIDVPNNVWETE